jgi:4-amino-4-deoxy-L-arabinose transferase-like glycosyltransferase
MTDTSTIKRPTRRILAVVIIVLAILQIIWIASTWEGMGYTKDEGYYFSAARDNFGWYIHLVGSTLTGHPESAFQPKTIDRYWRNNNEHPPFCKTVQGFHHHLLNKWLPILNYGNSHRAATLSWSILLIAFMVLLGSEWLSLGWAVGAVAILFTLPRVFFHAHLNTFDIPVVAMWFVTAYAFRRGMENRRWAWATGVLLGIGLATKNNAYFLPVLFFIMYVISPHFKALGKTILDLPGVLKRAGVIKLAMIAILAITPLVVGLTAFDYLALVIAIDFTLINLWLAWLYWFRPTRIAAHIAPILTPIFTAPFVFVLLWPWIWHDTWPRLGVYFNRHLHPPAWETYYLDQIVVNPPPFDWHYPFVMSWYTLPAIVLFVFFVGLALMLWRGKFVIAIRRTGARILGRDLFESPETLGKWEHNGENKVTSPWWDKVFLLVNIILPVLIIANPKTPIYGGTKHYMTALPYFAFACVIALRWMVTTVAEIWPLNRVLRGALAVVLSVLVIVPGLIGIHHTHPYTLSYYNEIMGGSIAAPEVGMQRTFWAQSTSGVLDYLNKVVPKNGVVYFNNTPGTSIMAYQQDGMLRKDIRPARRGQEPDYAVMNHWKFYTDRVPGSIYHIRQEFGVDYMEAWADIDGMPLVEVYRNVKKIGPSPAAMPE